MDEQKADDRQQEADRLHHHDHQIRRFLFMKSVRARSEANISRTSDRSALILMPYRISISSASSSASIESKLRPSSKRGSSGFMSCGEILSLKAEMISSAISASVTTVSFDIHHARHFS